MPAAPSNGAHAAQPLAKCSATPGRTQTINFYGASSGAQRALDNRRPNHETFRLVDLPGYGPSPPPPSTPPTPCDLLSGALLSHWHNRLCRCSPSPSRAVAGARALLFEVAPPISHHMLSPLIPPPPPPHPAAAPVPLSRTLSSSSTPKPALRSRPLPPHPHPCQNLFRAHSHREFTHTRSCSVATPCLQAACCRGSCRFQSSSPKLTACPSQTKLQRPPPPPPPSYPCCRPLLLPLGVGGTARAPSLCLPNQGMASATFVQRCCSSRSPQVPPFASRALAVRTHSFSAAATAAAHKSTTSAQPLHRSNQAPQPSTNHKIVSDGRGRHTTHATSSPWVLNVDSLLKNGGKPT